MRRMPYKTIYIYIWYVYIQYCSEVFQCQISFCLGTNYRSDIFWRVFKPQPKKWITVTIEHLWIALKCQVLQTSEDDFELKVFWLHVGNLYRCRLHDVDVPHWRCHHQDSHSCRVGNQDMSTALSCFGIKGCCLRPDGLQVPLWRSDQWRWQSHHINQTYTV